VAGLSLRNGGRSSTIRRVFEIEPQLLHIERSDLRWFIWLGNASWSLPFGGFFLHVQQGGGLLPSIITENGRSLANRMDKLWALIKIQRVL